MSAPNHPNPNPAATSGPMGTLLPLVILTSPATLPPHDTRLLTLGRGHSCKRVSWRSRPDAYGLLRCVSSHATERLAESPLIPQEQNRDDGSFSFVSTSTNLRDRLLKIPPEIRSIVWGYILTVRYYVPVLDNGLPQISRLSDPALVGVQEIFKDKDFGEEAAETFYKANTFCVPAYAYKKFLQHVPAGQSLRGPELGLTQWLRSIKVVVPCWELHHDRVDGKSGLPRALYRLHSMTRSLLSLQKLKSVEIVFCIRSSCHWWQEIAGKFAMMLYGLRLLRREHKLHRVTLRHYELDETEDTRDWLSDESHEDIDNTSNTDNHIQCDNSNEQVGHESNLDHRQDSERLNAEFSDYDGKDIDTCSITSDVERTRVEVGSTVPTHQEDKYNVYIMAQTDVEKIKDQQQKFAVELKEPGPKWIYSDADITYWFENIDQECRRRFSATEHPVWELWHFGFHQIEKLMREKSYPKNYLTVKTLNRIVKEMEHHTVD